MVRRAPAHRTQLLYYYQVPTVRPPPVDCSPAFIHTTRMQTTQQLGGWQRLWMAGWLVVWLVSAALPAAAE